MKTDTQGSWAAAELRRFSDSKQAPAHTPGPWRISKAVQNTHIYSDEFDTNIASVKVAFADIPPAMAEANARLIAAAPELLAALQQADAVLLRAYEAWGTNNQYNSERCALELCRSAIAKATGQGEA